MTPQETSAFKQLERLASTLSRKGFAVDHYGSTVPNPTGRGLAKYVDWFGLWGDPDRPKVLAFIVATDNADNNLVVGYANDQYVYGWTDLSRGHEYLVLTQPKGWGGTTSKKCPSFEEIATCLNQ